MIEASFEELRRSPSLGNLGQPEVCSLVHLLHPLLVFEIGHSRDHRLYNDHQDERQDCRDFPQRRFFVELVEDGDEEEEEVGDADLAESKHLDFGADAVPIADLVARAPFLLVGVLLSLAISGLSVGRVRDLSTQLTLHAGRSIRS